MCILLPVQMEASLRTGLASPRSLLWASANECTLDKAVGCFSSSFLLSSLPHPFPPCFSVFSIVVVIIEYNPIYILEKVFTSNDIPGPLLILDFETAVLLGCSVHSICLRGYNEPSSMEVLQEVEIFQGLGIIRCDCKSPLGMFKGILFSMVKILLSMKTPWTCAKLLILAAASALWLWMKTLTCSSTEGPH